MRIIQSFDIQPGGPEPIYRQIIEQVRRRVTSGNLMAGDELPSVRAVAQQHAINPMTVSKAYSLLEAERLLERRRGTGMFVAPVRPSRGSAQRLALLDPALHAVVRQAQELGLTPEQVQQRLSQLMKRLNSAPDNPTSLRDEDSP